MSSIEEFWIKNNLSELDDETAKKIAEEFNKTKIKIRLNPLGKFVKKTKISITMNNSNVIF